MTVGVPSGSEYRIISKSPPAASSPARAHNASTVTGPGTSKMQQTSSAALFTSKEVLVVVFCAKLQSRNPNVASSNVITAQGDPIPEAHTPPRKVDTKGSMYDTLLLLVLVTVTESTPRVAVSSKTIATKSPCAMVFVPVSIAVEVHVLEAKLSVPCTKSFLTSNVPSSLPGGPFVKSTSAIPTRRVLPGVAQVTVAVLQSILPPADEIVLDPGPPSKYTLPIKTIFSPAASKVPDVIWPYPLYITNG